MTWVLILLFNVQTNMPVVTSSMEFNSQESCINAGEKVRAYWQYNDEALKPKAICVKK